MAAPVYASDLTDILVDMASTTGWTAIGTPAALTAPETDDFIQGSNCISKGAWSSAVRGMIYSAGTVTVTAGDAVFMWMKYDAPGSLDVEAGAPGGMQVIIGDAATVYYGWDIRGSDTILYGGWVCGVVDPTTSADDTTGSPSSTTSFFGGKANVPSGGPSKGSPWKIDAFRHGRAFTCTNGDLGSGYATFIGAAAYNDNSTRRYGQIQEIDGGYLLQGLFEFGTSGTSVDFRDSGTSVLIARTPKVGSTFTGFEVNHASSRVDCSNIAFTALGTNTPGYFTVTDNADVNLTNCPFTGMGAFTFLSNTSALRCIWRGCDTITAGGADLTGSSISEYEGTAGTSPLIWNVATDPDGLLDDMSFTKGTAATHAIEFGTSSPLTMNLAGIDFSGYNATDAQNDSTFHIKRTSGTVTINISGGSGNLSYKTDGATVVIVQDPVTTEITVKDATDFTVIQNARVAVSAADAAGDMNYQESVTITSSSLTATAAHTAHGLETNDWVLIEGANEQEYNGSYQITVTGVDAYTYTMTDTSTSPATGTIISTEMIFNDLSSALGIVTDTRSISTNQNIVGRVRKSSSSPYYKNSPITAEIDSSNGLTITVLMIPDE